MSLVKNLLTQWRETEEENQLNQLMKKLLEQNDKQGKNRQDWLMKNLLTKWELRRETDLKLEFSKLVLYGFLDRVIGDWLVALLFSSAGPSRRRSNHQGSEPLGIKPSWVGTSRARTIRDWAIGSRAIRD